MFHVENVEPFPSRESLAGGIEFRVRFRNANNQRYCLLESRAAVKLRGRDGKRVYIDQAFAYELRSYQEVARNGEGYIRLFMPMTHANVVLVEEARGNHKLQLSLEVVFVALPLDGAPSENVPPRTEVLHDLTIEKSQWIEEFLPAFGMDDFELWEVRFPRVPTPDILEAESELLKKALHEYNNGEYANCYQNCRKVYESIVKRQAELEIDGVVDKEEWSRAKGYLSVALHVDKKLPERVLRRDAEFAFSITRAFYQRAADAVQRAHERELGAEPSDLTPRP